MLTRKILLASAIAGAGLMTTAAQAGHMAGMSGMHSVNVGSVANRLSALNCKNFGSGHPLQVTGSGITNNINRSTNVNVNKALTVYSPVTVTNNIDRSTNINAQVNIDNSKYIDNSTNITVNKSIDVRTTNIFNGMGSGSDHSQGGTWGGHSGGMGGGGCGTMCGGGGSNSGGGSNQNNNGNSNSNGNSNGNSNENNIDNSSNNSNTINNSNAINAQGAIDSFFNGLHQFQ